ncbi:Peptidylprolyl isomerase [Sulfidibacter corallicola]|uniref:Peptidylprolyl isomerase n=1 Tax=Sulfidibacter corallicola TaxID=2818388 RepID=A0A8A4TDG1_SULCO|nr:peptidylprolyl isomerase [Sulfidibacter corallicola]QTD47693.1 peptidylprolyl isomerase [Sulfidibacter corallicola]
MKTRITEHTAVLLIAVVLMVSACSNDPAPRDSEPVPSIPPTSQTEPEPVTPEPEPEEPRQLAMATPLVQYLDREGDYCASHILIAHRDAVGADLDVIRTREEALALASELANRLQSDPTLFAYLAHEHANTSAASPDGHLGAWNKGEMAEALEDTLDRLTVGQVTPDPIETPFGFHIVRRETKRARHYRAVGLFIPFATETSQDPQLPDKAEAEEKARDIGRQISPESFEAVARELDPEQGPIELGVFAEGDRRVPHELVEKMKVAEVGAVIGPLLTPRGFGFFQRREIETWNGAHILVAHRDAAQVGTEVTRTREEAIAETQRLIQELEASMPSDPTTFARLAREFSDAPSRESGGHLGRVWHNGDLIPEFSQALATLAVGEFSRDAVETPFGFHILLRLPVPRDFSTHRESPQTPER